MKSLLTALIIGIITAATVHAQDDPRDVIESAIAAEPIEVESVNAAIADQVAQERAPFQLAPVGVLGFAFDLFRLDDIAVAIARGDGKTKLRAAGEGITKAAVYYGLYETARHYLDEDDGGSGSAPASASTATTDSSVSVSVTAGDGSPVTINVNSPSGNSESASEE
jgi:hypothetical protein